MEHLSPEVLARLVDEAPTAEESAHLAECGCCTAELEALREQTAALGQLPDIRPNPGDWATVEARLTSEGLLEGGANLRFGLAHTPGWMKVAAARCSKRVPAP